MSPILHLLRLLVLPALVLLAACNRPAPRLPSQPQRTESWPAEVVDAMASLPVQHEGRVKPFSTLAAFALYDVHGRRDLQYTVPAADGGLRKVTLEPTEWLLDVWCYPEQAADYPLFRIEHSGVLDALGFANDGQTQGFVYLSYNQISERYDALRDLARKYRDIKESKRSEVESQISVLYQQFVGYMTLHQQLGPLQGEVALEGDALRAVFGGAERVHLGSILAHTEPLRTHLRGLDKPEEPKQGNVSALLEWLGHVAQHVDGPLLLPPVLPAGEADTWHSIGEVVGRALLGQGAPVHVAMVQHLQTAVVAPTTGERGAALRKFRDAVVAAAQARGEHGKVELETYYYRANWHYQSIHWFLLGFVLAAVCWLVPRNRLLWWASLLVTTAALGMLVYDVVLRCLVTERPPIKNLYDTFLFIAAVGVATSLVAEWVLPRRLALALAPLLGAVLVMFARLFEVADGKDTMAPLVAVLDSNFWLATHVTIINIGYAAGLVAAAMANVWILLRVLRLVHPDAPAAKAVVRMAYGVTCFSLIFSVVGTILGGVWANDSWGRFWGWDPKENGALLICLSQIALLHARFSGWVRDAGFVVWSSLTGIIVVFSWFHVNLLQVGLHSYGFSAGLRDAVWWTYVVELGMIGVGLADVWLRPNPAPLPARAVAHGAAALAGE
jgi:ABC-type transport system involved in cytochrome c biogenesis permease subunit